jgi:hypothetical protein
MPNDKQFDINAVSEETLMTVDGIGSILAARICADRPFDSWEDVRKDRPFDSWEDVRNLHYVGPIRLRALQRAFTFELCVSLSQALRRQNHPLPASHQAAPPGQSHQGQWRVMNREQRSALVDQRLCHRQAIDQRRAFDGKLLQHSAENRRYVIEQLKQHKDQSMEALKAFQDEIRTTAANGREKTAGSAAEADETGARRHASHS